jgi:hypothetical protein
MHTDLGKIRAQKEKTIKEYYKSFISNKGSGLDKLKDPVTSTPLTKKRRLIMSPKQKTQKQFIKTTALADKTPVPAVTKPDKLIQQD